MHDNNDQMQTVLFERGGETWPGRRRHSCLDAIETFTQQLVCIVPDILTRLVVDVTAFTLVRRLVDNVTDDRVLHRDAGQFPDVRSGRLVVLMP